jgi:excinuclease ABC subunit A
MVVKGAIENNLKGDNVRIPVGVLTGICGVSGSGKSTLMADTIGRILAPRKQTTSVAYEPIRPGKHDAIEGAPDRTVVVDQAKRGITTPADFLGLEKPVRDLYVRSEDSRALGIDEGQLGKNCSACGGRGSIRTDMGFLPDAIDECEACKGTGYTREAWDVRFRGVSLPELFSLTIEEAHELLGDQPRLGPILKAAIDVGLGYLVLRQPGFALSGGEAQRLKIAGELRRRGTGGTLYILDEPTVGQHMEDVARLIGVLHRVVEEGNSVVVVEHSPHVLASCDWLIELGPVGGPEGGHVVSEGTPPFVAARDTPTAPYLREALEARG